ACPTLSCLTNSATTSIYRLSYTTLFRSLAGKNWKIQKSKRLMMDEISEGMDELGVLLMGHAKGAYWYGSQLTIEEARACAPHNRSEEHTSELQSRENLVCRLLLDKQKFS